MRYIFQGAFKDLSGNAVSEGSIVVKNANTTALSTIYSSSGSSTAITTATINSTSNGTWKTWLDSKDYNTNNRFDIELSKVNFRTTNYTNIAVFPETEWTYYADSGATDQATDSNDNSLADINADIGSTDPSYSPRAVILKPGTYSFDGSSTKLTIKNNITLKPQSGAILSDGGNAVDLEIDGGFDPESKLNKHFDWSGGGNVIFGVNSVGKVRPEWWGENVAPGTTNMTTAIQSAIDSVKGPPTTGIIKLQYNSYAITSLTIYEGIILEGSGWMMNGNGPFGNAIWTASNYFGTFLIASGASNAIEFDAATINFTKPQMKYLAIVGPGSGTTIGINAVIAGGGINNAYDFLDNILVGNFHIGIDMESFTSGSISNLVIKGNEIGWRHGNNSNNNNDLNVYRVDVQQNEVGIQFISTALTAFYGGLIQGNQTGTNAGIEFANTVSGEITDLHFYDFWFEGNNNIGIKTSGGTGTVIQRSSFHNCKSAETQDLFTDAKAWTRVLFENCSFTDITFNFDDFTSGGVDNITLMNTQISTIDYNEIANLIKGLHLIGSRTSTNNDLTNAPRTDTIEITSAQIKTLQSVGKQLIRNYGADFVPEVISALLIYDYGTAVYVEPSTPDNMVIEYNSGQDITDAIVALNFITVANDEVRLVKRSTTAMPESTDLKALAGQAINLINTGTDYTNGDGTMTVKITYILHELKL